MNDLAKEGLALARDQMEFMIAVFRNYQKRDWAEVGGMQVEIPDTLGYHNQGYMASDPIYGSSSLDENPRWDPARWNETRPWDWYMGEGITDDYPSYPIGGTTPKGTKAWPQMEACTGVPLYDGQPVEVGPRARLNVQGLRREGHHRPADRPADGVHGLLLQDPRVPRQPGTSAPVLADEIPQGDGSLGWAANEAPRGCDVHLARVKDGKVQYYSMLVPTTWNFPTCSRALTGAPWQLAEVVVRGYDPCVSCATHMIVVDEKNRLVAERLIQ